MTVAPWLTVADLPADAPELPGTPEQQATAWAALLASASRALWALSGRRWAGERQYTVEVWAPAGSSCLDPCRPRELRLPHRDARDLTAVELLDGTVLDADAYLLDRGGYLGALPGRSARLPTASSSLVLTYTAGRNPPPEAAQHAGRLAVELGRAWVDPDGTALPGNVTSIARQGITMTYESGSAIVARGSTGLYEVDLWLASVNPTHARRPARAYSPDTDARYRIVNAGGTP